VSILKCLCIVFTAYWLQKCHEEPFCTLGDAVSSFLQRPDCHTIESGIATRASFQKKNGWKADAAQPMQWHSHRLRWYAAASRRRWIFTTSM
jgi:hypothetical protein